MTRNGISRGVLVPLSLMAAACSGPPGERPGDWPVYGGDQEASQYAALDQINRANVGQLEVAWEWGTGDKAIAGPLLPVPGQGVRPGAFENTPLVINDTMIVTTPYNRVVALDAGTGEELWTFDPLTTQWGQPPNGTGFVHRGVAVWTGRGERRVFLNTRWRLLALDFKTGRPIDGFGDHGVVTLTDHLMWPTNPFHYTQTSPPVVYGNLVILGNGVWDGFVYERDPPGNILAFDVEDGELAWRFNLIPQDGEFGAETWKDGSNARTGHTNAWAQMSLDPERGFLYVPVGTPSNDWYGGARKGANLFAESVVCLNAATGERVWHFQVVHHGLWDYDLAGAPTLLTVQHDGRQVDAVAQAVKSGFLFVFDRATGEPLWPIEERPVPESDVPGEEAYPTQPFPTRPEPFARQDFTEDDVIDFTPGLRAEAMRFLEPYRMGPLYTPPSMEGTLMLPGVIGGADWGGSAADPETGWLYIKSSESPARLKIVEGDRSRYAADYVADLDALGIRLPNGLPVTKPPYGTLVAYDLNTGEKKWAVPVGDMPDIRYNPALRGVELPGRLGHSGASGPMVTMGGLVFVSGGASALYAFDKETGEELWSADLDGRGYANPMSYTTRAGRQYVAIANGSGDGTKLTVFALPGS